MKNKQILIKAEIDLNNALNVYYSGKRRDKTYHYLSGIHQALSWAISSGNEDPDMECNDYYPAHPLQTIPLELRSEKDTKHIAMRQA